MASVSDEKILLIEDNLDDQLIARMAINRLKRNIDLYIATDTLEALQYLSLQAESDDLPSMILLDFHHPNNSGPNFLNSLADINHEKIRSIPVYIVSHETNKQSLEQINQIDRVHGFIPKPLVSEKLEALFAP